MIYEIAGLRVEIANKHAYTTKFCGAYLSENQDLPADLTATVTDAELQEEREASPGFSEGYIENICLYRSICRQIPMMNRFLLHASILECNGKAYAFLGRSGTGKSTHTKLWLRFVDNTRVLNGDKPILEYCDGKFYAHGTPWQGKENWGYKGKAELCGLCFLEQAKVNEIAKLPVGETSSRVFTQVLLPQDEENVVATLDLLDKLVAEVPAYLLKCDISEEAVKCSFEKLTGEIYAPKIQNED